jgi:hypothetical protein
MAIIIRIGSKPPVRCRSAGKSSHIDIEDMLAFSVLENVRPMIERVPLAQAADAYAGMMAGKARFRMVLVTGQYADASPVPSGGVMLRAEVG